MKLTKHAWSIWAISLVLVIVLMIVIPFVRTASWWIGAGCTILMFALCAFTFYLAFRKREDTFSKVLGWPIFRVGYTALIVQIIVGAVIMGIAFICPAWAAVIAQILVFAITGICLTLKDAARETVTASEAKVADNTAAWKAVRAKAASIAASTGNPDMKKLAEEIRFADPTPTEVDGKIADLVDALADYGSTENINKVMKLVQQRKSIAKESKK